ncbi:aldo/keto reductase [Nostoc carneum NIES-2107]|nr:aldo/keto reductase [Nostoc carneum NIES-2107]
MGELLNILFVNELRVGYWVIQLSIKISPLFKRQFGFQTTSEIFVKTKIEGTKMLYRELGSTGERVSAIGLGGWHLSLKHVDEQLAIRLVRTAIDRGITFMDNSWDYNGGESEIRMGKALRDGYRDKVFLMTKIDGRSKKEATKQLDECLKRLQVDCIDLVQHHEILRFDDPHRVFDEEGANAALVAAKAAGKLRYIGFTGHKDPEIHLHMLQVADNYGFKFAAAQMPLNVMDAHYRSFAKLVVPELVKRNIGILGMKSMANGILLKSKTVTPIECLHYALNLPTSVVITGIDNMQILEQAFQAVETFQPMTQEQVQTLLAKTADAGSRGEFEPFKTSSIFDGTAKNPDWLGDEPKRLQQLMSA